MSDTTDYLTDPGQAAEPAGTAAPTAETRPRRRAAGLSGMLLPELQGLASSLGITGTGRMRKGELVAAIQAKQGGGDNSAGQSPAQDQLPLSAPITEVPAAQQPVVTGQTDADSGAAERPARSRQRRSASRPAGSPDMAPAAGVGVGDGAPVEAAVAGDRQVAPVTGDSTVGDPTTGDPTTGGLSVGDPTGGGPTAETAERPARRERSPRGERAGRGDRSDGAERADTRGESRDSRADTRGESRADGRDTRADGRDTRADGRDTRADSRAEGRDSRGEARDSRGEARDTRADSRAEGRDSRGEARDTRGEARDTRADVRDTRSDSRADGRDTRAEVRDTRADTRADGRDTRAEVRDSRGESRTDQAEGRTDRIDGRGDGRTDGRGERTEGDRGPRRERGDGGDGDRGPRRDRNADGRPDRTDRAGDGRDQDEQGDRGDRRRERGTDQRAASDGRGRPNDRNPDRGGGAAGDDDDDFDGRGSRRRGRFRDRNRRNRTPGGERFAGDQADPVISDDDVLLPVAGILDILDNYAFIRTSGYLTGPNDVYVSLAQVRRNGLRRGDAVTGAVKQPRDGERRDKYNALVRLDTVNGMDPEQARSRPEFMKLTPLYPQDRLRLETEPHLLTPRVIDLVMPIGKGQRALIVSPPKAGKTMIMQAIANAVTTNNPECHLMVVLVDERPEEVTDMQRAVKGEVIASTFDRPPTDHTTVAELSIERAKRLVELGHDVVVLLDNITRLGRAYNLAAPASGRILSGGVDSTALYPPKRFLGAARNIENGGSLTILATALIETGSTMDTVIFEEFKGTGNAELILSRKIANKRVFPAVDVIQSSTRKEEILLAPDELAIVHKLRRVLNALDPESAIELLLDRLKQSRTNIEFLMQIAKSAPGQD